MVVWRHFGGSSNDQVMAGLVSMSPISSSKGAPCVLNFEVGPSNPTPRQVVVDIPAGVDLLSDYSMAAKLARSLLGPEEKARLEKHYLEISCTNNHLICMITLITHFLLH